MYWIKLKQGVILSGEQLQSVQHLQIAAIPTVILGQSTIYKLVWIITITKLKNNLFYFFGCRGTEI